MLSLLSVRKNDAPNRSPAPWKVTIWAILLAGLLGALADVLSGANRLAAGFGELRATLSSVFGPAPHEVTVPFEAVGPHAAVGCGETSPSSASVAIPNDAYEVQARCEWVETDGLKGQPCSAVVEGGTVKATGSIVGRDREWTGNCPGGGHGKLKVSGSYKRKVR